MSSAQLEAFVMFSRGTFSMVVMTERNKFSFFFASCFCLLMSILDYSCYKESQMFVIKKYTCLTLMIAIQEIFMCITVAFRSVPSFLL